MTIRHIHILVNTALCSGRDILQGALQYATNRSDWHLHVCDISDGGIGTVLNAVAQGRTDGIVTSEMEDARLVAALEDATIPVVVIGTRDKCLPRRKSGIALVTSDEVLLGAKAAQHFLYLGKFRTFGYVNLAEPPYSYLSKLRERGFMSELAKKGIEGAVYTPCEGDAEKELSELRDWIAALPRPAAILAGHDKRATQVLDLCQELAIPVPGEIRILGIDNYELLCLSSRPTLSSVRRDPRQEGLVAANELCKIISRRKSAARRSPIICKCAYDIMSRGTTSVLSPGQSLVQRAREYISANAMRELTPRDVVEQLHVSQRLLYLRFREFSSKSIQRTIDEARIDFVKRKLAETGPMPIGTFARLNGFRYPNRLRAMFRRVTGRSLADFLAGLM